MSDESLSKRTRWRQPFLQLFIMLPHHPSLFAARNTKLKSKNKRNLATSGVRNSISRRLTLSWRLVERLGPRSLPFSVAPMGRCYICTLEGNFSRSVCVKVIWIMAQHFGTTTNKHGLTKMAATLCHNARGKLKRRL